MGKIVATLRVPCCGDTHTIGLCRNGKIKYFAHKRPDLERLLHELGAHLPECLEFQQLGLTVRMPPMPPPTLTTPGFFEAVKRVQKRRMELLARRNKLVPGFGKKLRNGKIVLSIHRLDNPQVPEPPQRYTPPTAPAWVPAYLKNDFRHLRPPMITHRRFKRLRLQGHKSCRAKVTFGSKKTRGWWR